MPVSRILLILIAPMLLALGACTTGFSAQVSRFQAMPAPDGQSFVVQAANPDNQGGLEFSQYASLVRNHLAQLGYAEASSAQSASLIVSLDYGVDEGRTEVVTWPNSYGRFGFGFGYGWGPWRSYYPRRGYYSPFYFGWDDPFWFSPFGYEDVDSYTVYTSFLDMDIKRASDGQSLFEGTAKARSRTDKLPALIPNLVEAMFTGFPGNSGETVKITVPPPPRNRD